VATKIATNKFRVHSVNKFIDSVQSTTNSNSYYVFAGRSNPFSDEVTPPDVTSSTDEIHYNIYDEMLFGKRVTSNDVVSMIRRVDWQSGNTYVQWTNTLTSPEEKNFYVVSQEGANYYVFKCLDNNNNSAVSDQPLFSETSAEDSLYQTNDGYIWKYMYTISAANWSKFATNDYVPVIVDSDVTANSISGSIELINVNSNGLRYDAYANGTILNAAVGGDTTKFNLATGSRTLSSVSDFYNTSAIYIRSGTGAGQVRTITDYIVSGSTYQIMIDSAFTVLPDITSVFDIGPKITITGDGSGAIAIANINTSANSISKIEMVTVGSGYSYADITISSNTTGTITAVSLTPIISPPGGHGSDVKNELVAKFVGVSATFKNNESGTIPTTNDYRKIGLLKDPLFETLTIDLTTSVASSFTDGETIIHCTPDCTNASDAIGKSSGVITSRNGTELQLTNVRGVFESTNSIKGLTSNTEAIIDTVSKSLSTFNQLTKITASIVSTGSGGGGLANTGFTSDDTITHSNDSTGRIFDVSYDITRSISNISIADPAVVTTAVNHGFANGQSVTFDGLNGSAINEGGVYWIDNADINTFELYTDSGLTTSFDNSANTVANTGIVTSAGDVSSSFRTFHISNVRGSITDSGTITSDTTSASVTVTESFQPDLIDNSGEVLYLENVIAIERANDQSEKIKIIFEY